MSERFGYKTIKDALVTLLGTTNVSDLNNGLAKSVTTVATRKPDNIVVADTQYPYVNVWLESVDEEFRGASTRKEVFANFQIDAWVKSMKSLDTAIDELQLLIDNIAYILRNNVGISSLSSTRGYIKMNNSSMIFDTDASGFIGHAKLSLQVIRYLN